MINKLSKLVHENSKLKGFFEKEKNIGEMLCLIHSEVSEALEADRENRYCTLETTGMDNILAMEGENLNAYYNGNIKGTFEEEMADIAIRVMDLCAFKSIDLEAHINAKIKYNSLREYKYGKKY